MSASHEILVIYDFDEDPTVPVIERLAAELPTIRGLRHDLGRGVLNAVKAGFVASSGESTEPNDVDTMVSLAQRLSCLCAGR